jgi:transcriptional regulator with XRE-family HTH domain
MKTHKILIAIGEKIRHIRKGRKISQEKLAELSNLHPTYISDIENGKVNASIYSYFQIAEGLNIPLTEIVMLPSARQNAKLDAALGELLSRVRSFDHKKQALFISAARGLVSGIEEG